MMPKKIAADGTSIFIRIWVIQYINPTHVLTHYGTQSISKFFEYLRVILRTKHVSNMVYHLQTSVQAECFK